MPTTARRRLVTVAAITALLTGGGVAAATWLATGSGSGAAQATTVRQLVVSTGTPVATLYPMPSGGYSSPADTGAIVATVGNPNPFPVDLTQVALGAVAITAQPGKTCAPGSIVPTAATVTLSPPVRVPAGSAGTEVRVPGALQMLSTAEDGCQGAAASVALTVSGVLA